LNICAKTAAKRLKGLFRVTIPPWIALIAAAKMSRNNSRFSLLPDRHHAILQRPMAVVDDAVLRNLAHAGWTKIARTLLR
jgi:hypothetical protein